MSSDTSFLDHILYHFKDLTMNERSTYREMSYQNALLHFIFTNNISDPSYLAYYLSMPTVALYSIILEDPLNIIAMAAFRLRDDVTHKESFPLIDLALAKYKTSLSEKRTRGI
jgi:hypothetical protein